ncbi:KAP family P-loop domain protein [Acinetobacter ursingii]|uniref:KAP family P-loop domain protein n=2 Tax=Acinetobacter ursingii TaxID=108980 RepID=UPI0021CD75CB|nr:KAP family P-loop domain protein [Acinetobacter ursingii]MCU4306265.1 KAP family P-loop domain protein [Acinetobacter ursingii]MCU4371806.1 KAP family P-loop domain protein [Acinetobacter ursingii]MCU4382730.1 KAP family P-loop domain protein [Acinetobacter ursingii]MDG9992940.1 KAP family P-loop domain protein [Acinetobacter ursingii]MDH0203807.1 KAP family P-loop domain protein [Acinetobacter ursingii]
MSLIEKEKKLKDLIEHNIKNEQFGTAIAITGSWGVGKTFFWKKFLDKQLSDERIFKKDNVFNRKYAYVSLFGLESLSDVKTHIYSSIESYHSSIEIPKWIKSLPSIFKDTRIAQLGINAPVKLIDSLMFAQVKDAIICFDDFERLSNKLDIKDVMGLANYLKLEKNCQVILILDEDKAESDNKQKYANYKEKLVDDVIIINSVEPLIRANTQDIDESLVEMMIKFSEELEIHNFRFFQKVIKLYREFRSKLPENVAASTKEIILVRILQGFLIVDFGNKYEVTWDDFNIRNSVRNLINKKYPTDLERSENIILSKLKKISYSFVIDDLWAIEFRKWFDQVSELDFALLNDLANSMLISETNNEIKEDFHKCFKDFLGLQVDKNFPDMFYEKIKRVVGLENLGNLSFALQVLGLFAKDVTNLEQEIIDWMRGEMAKDISTFRLHESFGEVRPIFKQFMENYKLDAEKFPNLIDAIFNIYIRQAWNNKDELAIRKASKEDWRKVLFEEIALDLRFNSMNSSYIVKEVLGREKSTESDQPIRNIITEIYNEKAQADEFYKDYMNFLISRLDN